MLAPADAVRSGSVLSTQVFNEDLTEYFRQQGTDTRTCFTTEFNFSADGKPYRFSTADASLDLDALCAIVSSGTASASEALLGDLYPYMDITLVGQQTHGKYCSGLMFEAEDFYQDYAEELGGTFAAEGEEYTAGWGLYVMYSRFADKDGVTRCMPDGLTPDIGAEDDPLDGYALGDPRETMLSKALGLYGWQTASPASRRPAVRLGDKVGADPLRPGFGMRIVLPQER